MTTLIEVRGGDSELIGRCDARCYNAEHPDCACVCGGRNHGVGLSRALDNTRVLADAIIAEYVERHRLNDYAVTVPDQVRQIRLSMFGV